MVKSPVSEDIIFGYPEVPDTVEPSILLVDKPEGCTSFDVVRDIRSATGVRKVGHAGTLDPMATGLLIILVARGATKQMEHFMELSKAYTGTLRLGATTPSYDVETEVDRRAEWGHLTPEHLEAAREPFLGHITQRPPMYSAVRVDGERLYMKARRGEKTTCPPRQVRVDAFELLAQDGPDVDFRIECSKGTYIRSLAHDYGQELGVGAHLVALRRTAVGPHHVRQAWPLARLKEELAA